MRNTVTASVLIQTVLSFILPGILGNCQKNSSVQQMAAVASDMASASNFIYRLSKGGEARREQRKDSTHTALQACDNTVASAAPFIPISNQKMNTRSRIIYSSPYQLRAQAFFVLIAHGRLYS